MKVTLAQVRLLLSAALVHLTFFASCGWDKPQVLSLGDSTDEELGGGPGGQLCETCVSGDIGCDDEDEACRMCTSEDDCPEVECDQLGRCGECANDDECPPGDQCVPPLGRCAPPCKSDDDCSPSSICSPTFGVCVECTEDEHCESDEFCITEVALCGECRTDADCDSGETCDLMDLECDEPDD